VRPASCDCSLDHAVDVALYASDGGEPDGDLLDRVGDGSRAGGDLADRVLDTGGGARGLAGQSLDRK